MGTDDLQIALHDLRRIERLLALACPQPDQRVRRVFRAELYPFLKSRSMPGALDHHIGAASARLLANAVHAFFGRGGRQIQYRGCAELFRQRQSQR
nr:hypothetical protein [Burkholderia lata]